jgi:uncharacterized coiled-coil protein SlyX
MTERIEHHHFFHQDSADCAIGRRLDLILARLEQLIMIDATTQKSLDNLNAAVAAQTTVEASVETLLTGMAAQIAALKTGVTDPAVLAAIDSAAAIVIADNAKTAAAVAANTPAA